MRAISTAGTRPIDTRPVASRPVGVPPGSRAFSILAAAMVAAATFAGPVRAQDVTYQETSNVHLEGGLGSLMSFAAKLGGGSTKDIVTTTYLSGHRMRVDNQDESTIYDADAGTITVLHHKEKTYFQETFEQMAQAMEAAQAQMQQAQAQQPAEQKGNKGEGQDSVKLNVSFHVSVDRPGDHQTVAGYDAERAFVTLEAVGTGTRQSDQQTQQVGTMVFFNDVWSTQGTPLEKAHRTFEEAMLKKNGDAIRSQARGMASIFAQSPEMSQGMKESAQQLQKLPGVPVRSTSYVVLVSPDHKFDRALALNEQAKTAEQPKVEKKKSGGFFSKLAKAAAKVEQSQNPDEQKKDDQKNTPPQATMMVVTTQVTSVKVGAIPASTFAIPAGYTGMPAPMLMH